MQNGFKIPPRPLQTDAEWFLVAVPEDLVSIVITDELEKEENILARTRKKKKGRCGRYPLLAMG